MKSRKGQISLNDAPSVVMIVGFVFLTMATLAFIAYKYGAAIPADETATRANETLTTVTETGEYLAGYSACNFEGLSVTLVKNATGGETISSGNYTVSPNGLIVSKAGGKYNNTNWKVDYTYAYTGAACNVTSSMQTEISNNTSIAGIVLTISLVGIVLSVLIGVFVLARNRGM